jgi:outer membrane protein assembly factor BamB
LTRGGEPTITPPRPHVVARVTTGSVEDMTAGFGQLWVDAVDRGQVLRVDPGRWRIVARIPVGRVPSGVTTSGGAVWAIAHAGDPSRADYTVARIDPVTNRVTARVALHGSAGALLGPAALPKLRSNGRELWALGDAGGVRIDTRRAVVSARVRWPLPSLVNANSFGLTAGDLWVHGADGRLLRLDARTGAERARLTTPLGSTLAAVAGPAVIVSGDDGSVVRIDPATGRRLWTAHLASAPTGSTARGFAIAGDTLWSLREDRVRHTERLTPIALASGRVLGSTPLKDTGADWLTVVGDQLWYARAPQATALSP